MDDEKRKEEQRQFQKKHYRKMYAALLRKRRLGGNKGAGRRYLLKNGILKDAGKQAAPRKAGKHTKVIAVAGMLMILLFGLMTGVSSCSILVAESVVSVLTGSYLSDPAEIDQAELYLTKLEMELEDDINHVEEEYLDYHEYRYSIGSIGHDPFILISYLSAIHPEFTFSDVKDDIERLYENMYRISFVPTTETRTRTEIRTRIETRTRTETQTRIEMRTRTETRLERVPVIDDLGNVRWEIYSYEVEVEYEVEVPYEVEVEYEVEVQYEVEVEYEVQVLTITLNSTPLETVVSRIMNEEETGLYETYIQTRGLLQVFGSPLPGKWQDSISNYYGYRIHPISGERQLHRGLDIAMAEGTPIFAAHAGKVVTAQYSDFYGNYVVIEGNDGVVTKYAHMKEMGVTAGLEVEEGTVIGTVGSSGDSTGNHLHLELLVDGEYYNPIFYFAEN